MHDEKSERYDTTLNVERARVTLQNLHGSEKKEIQQQKQQHRHQSRQTKPTQILELGVFGTQGGNC